LKTNISGAPVVDDGGNYLGVFSEKCSINAMTASVELADRIGIHVVRAREIMTCNLTTLSPDVDVFDAIDHILSKRISGAPVVDHDGTFLGIFSEKTAMRVLVSAAYDQLPGTNVRAYMNTDRKRIIDEDSSLLAIAHLFQQTPYRRLPILSGNSLAGQISRRDVLRAELRVAKEVVEHVDRRGLDTQVDDVAMIDVSSFMDRDANTTRLGADLLSIAQIFLNTPYRRLPVVEDDRLVGQISRRDLLDAAAELLRPKPQKHRAETLYFSPLSETRPPSLG
jgi:CBS domain-containing protein